MIQHVAYSNSAGWRIVPALVDIPANVEVTVDYTMEGQMLAPTFRHFFICQSCPSAKCQRLLLIEEDNLARLVDSLMENVQSDEYEYQDTNFEFSNQIKGLQCHLSKNHYLGFLVAKLRFLFYNCIGEMGDLPTVISAKQFVFCLLYFSSYA